MAFVSRAEKPSYVDEYVNKATPGPGTYLSLNEYQPNRGYAPFSSTTKRIEPLKKDDSAPGPGSYNISVDLTNQAQKLSVASVNADPRELEAPKLSNVFKSKTQRFAEKFSKHADTPGPGAYYKEDSFGRRMKSIPGPTSQRRETIQNVLGAGKYVAIPSIPSNVHGYGYSENESNPFPTERFDNLSSFLKAHELQLNKNPLIEAHKLVGPGYYNPKDGFAATKPKGISWQRSGPRRIGGSQKRAATTDTIGPGSYDLTSQFVPLYKMKQSAGFASATQRRTFDSKAKPGPKQSKSFMNNSYHSSRQEFPEDPLDMEEYIEEATPGPGYYHNPSVMSSIKVQYKPERLQFFGTSSQRFQDIVNKTINVGPGDYDITKEPNYRRKAGRSPFALSNGRNDKMRVSKTPGPGSYEPKIGLVHQLEKRVKNGYQGNFGTTDRRFKTNALTEDNPGPGTYTGEVIHETPIQAKPSAPFISSTKRDAYQIRNDAPAPNAYNVDNLTIAKSVIREEDEDPELLPKREPFNSSQPRFKEPKREPEHIDPMRDFSRTAEAYTRAKIKPKPSAAFATTKRSDLNKSADGPGPGAYYDPSIVNNQWNKRTYNILFAEV